MHSHIIQISDKPIGISDRLSEDNIREGEMVTIDYAEEIAAEKRCEVIRTYVNEILPKGMFTFNEASETITYNGGMKEWKRTYLNILQQRMEKVTEENIMDWIGPVFDLQKAIVDPFEAGLFITDFNTAERSRGFMEFVARLDVGDTLYIGSIFDYHY